MYRPEKKYILVILYLAYLNLHHQHSIHYKENVNIMSVYLSNNLKRKFD